MRHETTLWQGQSRYARYEVVEQIYHKRPARLLFSGQREAVQSGLALDGGPELLFDYNQRFRELVRVLRPARVLLVGGGALTLPTALLADFPGLRLDVVERDPLLSRIAADYFGFKPHPGLHLYHVDGWTYLRENTVRYDLVLMDVFSHLQVPETLSTVEAVRAIRRSLRPAGCVAMNIVSPYFGRMSGAVRRQMAVYGRVFARVSVFPADATGNGWQNQNLVLVARQNGAAVRFRYDALPPPDDLPVTRPLRDADAGP